MDRWIHNDTTLKVLAVALSLILWIQVTGERQRPEVQRVFENMPVSWRYLEGDVSVLELEPRSVTIVVRGERAVMDFLSRHDLDPVINLRGAPPGSTSVYVSVSVPKGVQLVEVSPDIVSVHLEPIREIMLEPQIELLGDPAPDYQVSVHKIRPAQVIVRGGLSLVEQVVSVEGALDVSEQEAGFSRSVGLRPVDERGSPVQGITLSPAEVTVDVEASPREETRSFPIKVATIGDPETGFQVSQVEVAPAEASLRGSVFLLDELEFIETEEIDLSGATETLEVEVALSVPPGTYLETEEKVLVTIEIQRD